MILHYLKRKWLLIPFIILCIFSVICSIKCLLIGTIISILGSIASLYTLIEALNQVKTIEKQNAEIRKAIDATICKANKQETTEQINKYIEVIARIISYIEVRNAEAALLKIEELQVFMHNVQHNPTTDQEAKKLLAKQHKTMIRDVLVLRDKNQNEPFPKDADSKELTKHFENLRDTLLHYSQQIHFNQ